MTMFKAIFETINKYPSADDERQQPNDYQLLVAHEDFQLNLS